MKRIFYQKATSKYSFLKKNIRASASFKCILLLIFCVIFVTHVYEIDILRKQKR